MTKIHTLLLLCLFALVLPVAGQEAEFKKIKKAGRCGPMVRRSIVT